MNTKETTPPGSLQPMGMPESHEDDYDCIDPEVCGMCGDDGWIMLSDAGPSEWGEDCFSEVDRPIECPECRERRNYEARQRAWVNRNRHTEKLRHGGDSEQ